MNRKMMVLTSSAGICVLLLVFTACKSSYSLASGKYSWKSTFIDADYPTSKPEAHNSTVIVSRDGNKVTIDLERRQIVGTLEGDKFFGHADERASIDFQGTLTANNHMEGTLTAKRNEKYAGKGDWTLEYISDK